MGLKFVGNKKIFSAVDNWFNDQHSKKIVIDGQPGNGKTYLIEMLAEKYGYYLHRIDPYDVTDIKSFNSILKTLNLIPIESDKKKKVILVENINEFHINYQKKLFDMDNVCRYPIVYTGTNIDIPHQYINKIEIFRLNKPVSSEIYAFLKDRIKELNIDIDDSILSEIAKQSPSVRSAINSLYNSSPNDITNPIPTFFEQLNSIRYHMLKDDVDRSLLHYIFGNIKDYQAMQILSDFDIELSRKFKEEIDGFIFNNLKFDFKSNRYPEFMKSHYENKNQYLQYTEELHVSSRVVKREFMDLINLLKNKDTVEQKSIKKMENVLNSNNIFNFV